MKYVSLFALCLFLAGCASSGKANVTLRGPGGEMVQVLAEIADEPEERTRGLMYRRELAAGEGMIFLFENPSPMVFWMKNTLIPLDIVFFDEGGTYLSSDTMVPCEADPCTLYRSNGPAAYVLEMASGFLQESRVGEGWRLDLSALPASLLPID